MIKSSISIIIVIMVMSFFISCDKKDPVVPNEEEVITTLVYTLTPSGGGTAITLSFKDLDGDGANPPVITPDTAVLLPDTTYTGVLTLSNESETPAEDITQEIREEDEEHQFFFQSTVTGLTIAYNDTDADGKPIGLSSTLTTTSANKGNIKITLRHEPDKSASGVSDGDITNAGGETDIEVTFHVSVQ